MGRATSCVCHFVCLCFCLRALKGKRLELSSSKSVDVVPGTYNSEVKGQRRTTLQGYQVHIDIYERTLFSSFYCHEQVASMKTNGPILPCAVLSLINLPIVGGRNLIATILHDTESRRISASGTSWV